MNRIFSGSAADYTETRRQPRGPGQLVHADKHGFGAIPPEDQEKLLETAGLMDSNECETMIAAARHSSGMSTQQMLDLFDAACQQFSRNAEVRFGRGGEFQ
ncbi:MAG: hypothetical protein JSU70_14625 [Phycisphaerales bacterium]|nr:MAG: hypothetical protein JSU70_14625 [Phycisphaerales bacterium]